jgi:hypothetical protein
MNIHHATVKSAASKGVILTIENDEAVRAFRPEPNRFVEMTIEDEEANVTELAKDAWVALDDILAWEAEHPGRRILTEDGDFVGYYHDAGGLGEELARDPDLNDLFETLENVQAEEENDGDEDEGRESGSVVPDKYKKEYAARGNPNHCGDWLADTLAHLCRVKDEGGKEVTDLDRLETIANANDVAPERFGKLGVETRGWQGRFRMTIRNMLVPRVATKGFLFVPEGCGYDADTEVKAPSEWVLRHSPKPKPAKAPKPEAAVAKNPGAGKKGTKKAAEERGLAAANKAVKNAKAKAKK